jgi:hypothetical protein
MRVYLFMCASDWESGTSTTISHFSLSSSIFFDQTWEEQKRKMRYRVMNP